MLTDLSIKNFAIIDSLHISFGSGLNILTGETGAGKSIIIDAVNLVMGGRASADLIRSGADEATVEALFDISTEPEICATLASCGIDADGELLLKRIISRSGKNRIFINGSLATLATLTEIACRLINIYGQHESQTLLKIENHLLMLDSYAGLNEVKAEFAQFFREHRKLRERIAALECGARDADRQKDILSYQLDEIRKASLLPGEDDELERELNLLLHAEKLLFKTQSAYDLLYGAEESALGTLGEVKVSVTEAAAIDSSLRPLCETVSSAFLQLEDAALSLRDYAARLESDPARIQAIQDRLDLIRTLKKKYGETISAIIATAADIEAELTALANADLSREELDAEAARLHALIQQKGAELSAGRRKAAERLCKALEAEVHQLAMKHASFLVRLEPLPEPREAGFEKVEFLFSPNPGEEPKPLAKIASGGELSRIMLAMKQLHPESDVPTLVFDEVDTGIGGATSAMVGKKLKSVATRQQVLCITHLPQVAVYADCHYIVAKDIVDGRTLTSLKLLAVAERIDEIARMLGGIAITGKSREHAAEMIEAAKD
ncbi:MAG: DNA repair protein RecN [Deltaproteobacteria bacterium HGW-Deltaproteobacteria-23]|nr:MAG: DNA repair protein RecN [Deltaproteobacteria bacterium HGW-Deltaproteobacteria-23]